MRHKEIDTFHINVRGELMKKPIVAPKICIGFEWDEMFQFQPECEVNAAGHRSFWVLEISERYFLRVRITELGPGRAVLNAEFSSN